MRNRICTNDPKDVASVVWNVAGLYDDTDGDETDEFEDRDYDARMRWVLDAIADAFQKAYPNATDIRVYDSGFEGNWRKVAPRCETESGAVYAPFYDEGARIEDGVVAQAIKRFPFAYADQEDDDAE